jgi:L-alanine-DL-glutamate epimerase-like enolase superfamily enzyme
MRITDIAVYRVCIPFRVSFGHALQWRNKTDTLIVRLTSDSGLTGWGEILPRPYLTGETIANVLSGDLPDFARRWQGQNFESLPEVITALRLESVARRGLAALAGWELAVLDLAGKTFDFAAGEILGQTILPELEAGIVIGFDVPTAKLEKYCALLRMAGRHHVKVKVGLADDLYRLEIANTVFGPAVPIRIDANAAWSVDEAVAALRPMQRCNVSSVEQPVASRDLNGMRAVREKTGMAVIADESLCSARDAHSIIAARAADAFNVRIGKCGGLLASQDLVTIANDAGLSCQLGTLVGETGILSRASEIFAERVSGFKFLEGKRHHRQLLQQDIVEEACKAGESVCGLGIQVACKELVRWTTSTLTMSGVAQGVEQ